MIYLALLRGINVGGKNRVEMARLKGVFESLGCSDVRTYINSGNVIFVDDRDATQLGAVIESAIATELGFDVRVLLRDRRAITSTVKAIPLREDGRRHVRCYVMFLWDDVDQRSVLERLTIKEGLDDVKYVRGAVISRVDRGDLTRSGMMKLPGDELYEQMTIRNCNTVRKVADMMRASRP
jgi:uncharacterized protein (DUF1697 family)